jgi:hypothetical protein
VSRLWRDRLLVSLAPDAVAAARIAGGLRARIIAKQTLDCDPAFGAEPWQGAVAALAALAGPLQGERMKVTVVLSNHFVRYTIVPFDPGVAGPDEEIALARFHFAKIHGERAKGWHIRMTEEPRGAPRLASAVDAGLLEAISACFPRSGTLRLASVQPYLMSAFNLWRSNMKGESWLLLVEPRRACLALLGARKWLAVHSSRGEFSSTDEWSAFLDRQRLCTDAAPASGTVLVHVFRSLNPIAAEANGWRFSSLALPALDGFLPLEDGSYTMALTAQ